MRKIPGERLAEVLSKLYHAKQDCLLKQAAKARQHDPVKCIEMGTMGSAWSPVIVSWFCRNPCCTQFGMLLGSSSRPFTIATKSSTEMLDMQDVQPNRQFHPERCIQVEVRDVDICRPVPSKSTFQVFPGKMEMQWNALFWWHFPLAVELFTLD